ncbi:unnamed protein product [Rotaria magnacalcarata]|uniref:RBR-type E3 ubiquitin transferase n=2 Tax=Rotaria magnacalcarata TaxID=392030 RepID=A0A819X1H1_9BILA|nr:unnamed protein product [Rotaria magnacalcarata]CAF2147971.1 unnamed protein product [Rotaria magnacalcarata]CAF3890026.1 unnamed protein product [Rotaria magnacalcarata]CAF3977074.1 unnamed protein product [Rotaria magnacalcarata]CAF4133681.1 unnamed protein product [Rotaria magnacalcarata]
MSVEAYSQCRIKLTSLQGQITSFDRCLIELRQYDIGDYVLRAIDVNSHSSEIFNCCLVDRKQYIFGASINQPDMIIVMNSTCHLWLNEKSRDQFHEVLRTCLEDFLIIKDKDNKISSQRHNQMNSKSLLNELSTQEDAPYYRNEEPFDCITCMETIMKGDGILFSNCLHPFCKQCLLGMIEASTEPTIKCPHENCTALIIERELRGVVNDLKGDQKVIDRLNDVAVRFAESRNKTFHCITPDCAHWWFIEPEETNNIIYCNGCKHWICTTCSAIHEGQVCRDYQEMRLREANESVFRKDVDYLETMIKNKEAMYCPGCRAIIQKVSGCDWIQCSQCKIEICVSEIFIASNVELFSLHHVGQWPTQGPRWGPKGHGDTSGGCRCRADNGKLCVPNCQNCH